MKKLLFIFLVIAVLPAGIHFSSDAKQFTVETNCSGKDLVWKRSIEDDVTHYKIYAKRFRSKRYTFVGTTLQTTPDNMLVRWELPAWRGFLYLKVSAVDESGNESRKSEKVACVFRGLKEDDYFALKPNEAILVDTTDMKFDGKVF